MADASLPPLREVIARHGLAARKSLGQHFLLDLNLTARIARAAGNLARGTTIEIGPGPGGLTRALLAAGARVIAIERDARCIEALAELASAYPGRLELIEGDALETEAASLGAPPRRIVANLPYNVATPLLIGWLRAAGSFESLTLMFQKEVAERIAAQPGAKSYGRLAVIAQFRCAVEPQFEVTRRAFVPPPKVDSAVIRLVPHANPPHEARFETLERVTAAAFGQRRKMLRVSLKSLGDAAALLDAAKLDGTLRAEQVGVAGFCALARALDAISARAGR